MFAASHSLEICIYASFSFFFSLFLCVCLTVYYTLCVLLVLLSVKIFLLLSHSGFSSLRFIQILFLSPLLLLRFYFYVCCVLRTPSCTTKLKRSSNVYQTIIKLMHALNIMYYGNILEVIFSSYSFFLFFSNLLRSASELFFFTVFILMRSISLTLLFLFFWKNFCCRLSKWYPACLCKNLEQIDKYMQITYTQKCASRIKRNVNAPTNS